MIVLDTHVLVWFVQGDARLGIRATALIEDERVGGTVILPSIMAWEIAMLVNKYRLRLGLPVADWFARILADPGFVVHGQELEIALDAGSLPGDIHGDPADRIMVATARSLGCALLTADRKLLAYASAGHVEALDARA